MVRVIYDRSNISLVNIAFYFSLRRASIPEIVAEKIKYSIMPQKEKDKIEALVSYNSGDVEQYS